MNKALIYILGFCCAGVVAVILRSLMQDEFGISAEAITIDSLASAGILSVAYAVTDVANARK